MNKPTLALSALISNAIFVPLSVISTQFLKQPEKLQFNKSTLNYLLESKWLTLSNLSFLFFLVLFSTSITLIIGLKGENNHPILQIVLCSFAIGLICCAIFFLFTSFV